MIILSSAKLENMLSTNALTSWEKAKYIIFVIVLYSFAMPVYVLTPSFGPKPPLANDLLQLVSNSIVIFITYKGIKKCYSINKDADDIDFIGRFVTLFVPMTVKFMFVWLPVGLVALFLASELTANDKPSSNTFTYYMNLTAPILTYLFYRYLQRSFGRLSLLVKKENV